MNPCRCGQGLEPGYACRRGPNERCMAQYQARISGPLRDRIDLRIEVPAVTAADLILPARQRAPARPRPGSRRPRALQGSRYAARGLPDSTTNATCPANLIEEVASPDADGTALIGRRPRPCASPHAAFTARCASPGPWPISTARHRCAGSILRRPSRTAGAASGAAAAA